MVEANLYRLTLATALKEGQMVMVSGKDDLTNAKAITYSKSAEVDPNKVTITFDAKGGSKVASKTIDKGSKVAKPNDPTKSGYKFLGWYIGNTAYNFSNAVNTNLTLVAKWQVVAGSTEPTKTQDEINMDAAKGLSITVSKGGVVPNTIGNCTVSFVDISPVSVIIRELSNTTKSLSGTITCGALSETKNITVNIPASTYSYTLVGEPEMAPVRYIATVAGGSVSSSFTFGKLSGTTYTPVSDSADGKIYLGPRDWDDNVFITHTMRINNDLKTLYKVRLSN